jgi:hypothetical protein
MGVGSAEIKLGSGKYINGATNALSNDLMGLGNLERRLPYVMYDLYPIWWNITSNSTGPNNIQDRLDWLINFDYGSPGYGVEKYRGIRQAILWAQNWTPNDPADDVPFYHTIQVQAENWVKSGQLINDGRRYRLPTRNEIFVQAYLATCYGAKGIMYFVIMTDTPSVKIR